MYLRRTIHIKETSVSSSISFDFHHFGFPMSSLTVKPFTFSFGKIPLYTTVRTYVLTHLDVTHLPLPHSIAIQPYPKKIETGVCVRERKRSAFFSATLSSFYEGVGGWNASRMSPMQQLLSSFLLFLFVFYWCRSERAGLQVRTHSIYIYIYICHPLINPHFSS